MSDAAISVTGLGKRYQLNAQPQEKSLRSHLGSRLKHLCRHLPGRGEVSTEEEAFWALQDINFEIPHGTRLGIIGRNGAGKSTLLKILSRITAPTTGQIRIRGRVSSLLEVGTGFHPELTGKENIFLNGAILGMKRREIQGKLDEIIAFAEIDRFLDTPVKHYSSGMYMRLAFAVAAHMDPDILIVDEVLAVGDQAFQKKCLGKLEATSQEGRTVLFVSHNLAAIRNLCTTAMLLQEGKLLMSDSPDAVIDRYLDNSRELAATPLAQRLDRSGNGTIRITALTASNTQGSAGLQSGKPLLISCDLEFNALPPPNGLNLAIGIDDFAGNRIALLNSEITGPVPLPVTADTHSIDVVIDKLQLLPGHYRLTLFCSANGKILDWIQDAAVISVENDDYYGTGKLPSSGQGPLLLDYRFSCRSKNAHP